MEMLKSQLSLLPFWLSDMSSPLFVHACYVGPEGHRAFKLAGVDQGEDQHGVYHHRHPEVLQDPSPPLKVHLDKNTVCLLCFNGL